MKESGAGLGPSGGDPLSDGFLGTASPAYADLTLFLELAMGVGLLIGAVLARLGRFRQHAWCQSVIVLLNIVLIVLTMIPSFHVHVSPKIPIRLDKTYYALATAHAALGGAAEFGGLYILLAAGTSVLPQKFRITNYKIWMRSVLCSGGLCCYWEWRPTYVGTSRISSGNEIMDS